MNRVVHERSYGPIQRRNIAARLRSYRERHGLSQFAVGAHLLPDATEYSQKGAISVFECTGSGQAGLVSKIEELIGGAPPRSITKGTHSELGKRLREHRERSGLSQTAVARAIIARAGDDGRRVRGVAPSLSTLEVHGICPAWLVEAVEDFLTEPDAEELPPEPGEAAIITEGEGLVTQTGAETIAAAPASLTPFEERILGLHKVPEDQHPEWRRGYLEGRLSVADGAA